MVVLFRGCPIREDKHLKWQFNTNNMKLRAFFRGNLILSLEKSTGIGLMDRKPFFSAINREGKR
jgi:hypothetical protein